jgi:hypothetical protein
MSTVANNIINKTNNNVFNKTNNNVKTDKDYGLFLGMAEVITFLAITATTILLIGITTWA